MGTYYKIVPFKSFIELGDSLKGSLWGEGLEPPYGHAELSSLSILIERTKLDGAVVENNLKKHQIHYQSLDSKIIDIANENHLSPSELFALMTASSKRQKKLPESGLGKLTFNEISKLQEVPFEELKQKFLKAGYQVEREMTLKEVANQKGVNPHDLIELIESSGD